MQLVLRNAIAEAIVAALDDRGRIAELRAVGTAMAPGAERAIAEERVRRALAVVERYWRQHATARGDLQGALEQAAGLFNARLYFEVHEILERAWNTLDGDVRRFVQGLIQIAVAFHHLENGNRPGARTLLAEGRAKVAPHAPAYQGVAVDTLLAALAPWERALASDAPVPASLAHPILHVATRGGHDTGTSDMARVDPDPHRGGAS